MADPAHSTAVAAGVATTAVAPLLFPALGDWSWVVIGSLGGATLAISMGEQVHWMRAVGLFAANTVAALMFARLLYPVADAVLKVSGASAAVAPEHMLLAVAALTAMYWRPIISKVGRRLGEFFGGAK